MLIIPCAIFVQFLQRAGGIRFIIIISLAGGFHSNHSAILYSFPLMLRASTIESCLT